MKNYQIATIFIVFFQFAIISGFLISGFPLIVTNNYTPAVKNLKEGWQGETLYQTSPLGPISICETSAEVLILDKAASEILTLNIDGSTAYFATTGNYDLDAINYQLNRDKVIAIGENCLYELNEGTFQQIKTYSSGIEFSTFTIDNSDDSIYTGSLKNNSIIYHFNATGHPFGSVVTEVQGCSQIALHPNNTVLYYTETYSGQVMALNLVTNKTTVLVGNIGIPGTGEGIGLAVDTIGTVYYYTAEGNNLGLNKYDQGGFVPVMGSKFGIGPIFWSDSQQSILCAAGAGACIVKYDPKKTEAELLTPTVNTRSIIETNEGRLFIGIENKIYELIGVELPVFAQLPGKCESMILTSQNKIFFGILNDTIALYKLEFDGSYLPWFSGGINGFFNGMKYDQKHHALIISVEVFSSTTDTQIWKIPIENPMNYQMITEFLNATRTSFTIDYNGNIYLLERISNILYKIPDGLNTKEILFTNFIEAAYTVQPHLGYSSIENGIIVSRNDDLQVWPLSGEVPSILAENNVGIDNDGVFENEDQELICTHSGQIYKLVYDKQESTTQPTTTQTISDSTSISTTPHLSPFLSFKLILLMIVFSIFLRKKRITLKK